MGPLETLKTQNFQARKAIARLARDHEPQGDVIPPGWRNNLRWHVGHLVLVPHRLTFGLLGEPLLIPEEYTGWFTIGTSPADWADPDAVPPLGQLAEELTSTIGPVHELCLHRPDVGYTKPIITAAGLTISNPAEALAMIHHHDGIHLGMMLALLGCLKREGG